jgi:hypothetical protein
MKCIICEEAYEAYHPSEEGDLHPMVSGTTFESTGNYGSTHWDCEGRKYLQIMICNDCLPKKADIIDVVAWTQPRVPHREFVSRMPYSEHCEKEKEANLAWEKENAERAAEKAGENVVENLPDYSTPKEAKDEN